MSVALLAIGLHIGSYHSNIDPYYSPNDFNPGVYVETIDNYMLGTYLNSDRKSTIYVGRAFHYKQTSLMIGLATGYNIPLVPAIIPAYNVPLSKEVFIKLWYIPKIRSAAEAVHFSIEWRIK